MLAIKHSIYDAIIFAVEYPSRNRHVCRELHHQLTVSGTKQLCLDRFHPSNIKVDMLVCCEP